MATIYRFIIEQKTTTAGDGRKVREPVVKGASKKGRDFSLFSGDRGGVEHNRKMRAINPLLNRMTGGIWEKGMRIGRASIGLYQGVEKNGIKGILSGPAVYIIFAFMLTMLMKFLESEQKKAMHQNMQNFKQLENGIGAVHSQYKVTTNFWTGRHTYNQNK